MNSESYNKNELKKLHSVEIEILDVIVELCEKHNLKYFLVGGSCLGAIRHQGFIPWDDDIDVAIPREDYNKFIEYAIKELDDKYFLDCPLTNKHNHLGFIKIKKNNTTFETEDEKIVKGHDGFFVDIFPIDYNNNRDSKVIYLEILLARSMMETLRYKEFNCSLRDLRHPILALFFYPLSNKCLHKIIDKLFQARNKKEHIYCAIYMGCYHYRKDIYPYDKVFPGKKVLFEGKEYYVYNDPDYYLSQLYGDYMKLPPVSKRVAHCPIKLDFNNGLSLKTFDEYKKNNNK